MKAKIAQPQPKRIVMPINTKLLTGDDLQIQPPPTAEATGFPSLWPEEQYPRQRKSTRLDKNVQARNVYFNVPILNTAEGDIGKFPIDDPHEFGRGRE